MTCESCEDTGVLHYTKEVEGDIYREGKAVQHYSAACLCARGLRRALAIPRIDRVFPLEVVRAEYFPKGLPRDVEIEIDDIMLAKVGLPRKMRSWTFDTYPDQEAAQLPAARAWVKAAQPQDLVLYGPAGTGKTGLAVAMLRAVFGTGKRVSFVQANEWLVILQSSFNKRADGESELDLLRPALYPDLLVLDDLNARRAEKDTGRMSAYFADVLQLILNKRQGDEKPTIFTTNLDHDELQEYLTPTIYDRLREGEFWEFTGASNRMPKPVLPFAPRGGNRRSARKKR